MGFKVFIVVLFATILLDSIKGQSVTYDYEKTIAAAGLSLSIDSYAKNCRYKIYSPPNTFMQATCTTSFVGNCAQQSLTISRSGEWDLRDGLRYCGSNSLRMQSIGNEVVILFTTSIANSGSFKCTITAYGLTNSNCDCSWNVNSKIVGGSVSGVNEFTSHAGLISTAQGSTPYCGAIIIQQKYALTAAHCLIGSFTPSNTVLLVGDHKIDTGSDTKWAASYSIENFIRHASYNYDTHANDIGLVKTKYYIRYTPAVSPACLPYTFNGYDFTGKPLVAAGWGTTEFGGERSNTLLKVSLPVVTNAFCASKMVNIDASKICTYAANQRRDTCGMDSGGGLYWYVNRNYPIAIISYGTYCASSYPSVNVRINSYIGWIENTVGGFFCRK